MNNINIHAVLNHRPISIEVLCMGFPDEVLLNYPRIPEQRRILEYAFENFEKTMFFGHTYELFSYVKYIEKNKRVEIVGAYSERCVFNSAKFLLKDGFSVKINPSLIVSQIRLSGAITESEDREHNEEWITRYLTKNGFSSYKDDNILLFNPN